MSRTNWGDALQAQMESDAACDARVASLTAQLAAGDAARAALRDALDEINRHLTVYVQACLGNGAEPSVAVVHALTFLRAKINDAKLLALSPPESAPSVVEPADPLTSAEQVFDGEWIRPTPQHGHVMVCCDCGLVHLTDFRVRDGEAEFCAIRSEALTARRRGVMPVSPPAVEAKEPQ